MTSRCSAAGREEAGKKSGCSAKAIRQGPVNMRGCKTNGRAWFAETGVSRRATERESRAAGQAGATKPQPVSRCSNGEREADARSLAMPWTWMDVGRRRPRQVEAGDGQEKGRGGRGSNQNRTTMGAGMFAVASGGGVASQPMGHGPRPSHAQQAVPHRRRMGGFGVRSRGHVGVNLPPGTGALCPNRRPSDILGHAGPSMPLVGQDVPRALSVQGRVLRGGLSPPLQREVTVLSAPLGLGEPPRLPPRLASYP